MKKLGQSATLQAQHVCSDGKWSCAGPKTSSRYQWIMHKHPL